MVELFDVLGLVLDSGGSVCRYPLLDSLLLQAAEEGLGHSIVPAVSSPARARLEMVCLAETSPSVAAILSALVGVNHWPAADSADNFVSSGGRPRSAWRRRLLPGNAAARSAHADDSKHLFPGPRKIVFFGFRSWRK